MEEELTMKSSHLLRLLALLLFIGVLCSPPRVQNIYDAQADLTFIANYIARNHPGIYNAKEDPGFEEHLWDQEEQTRKTLNFAHTIDEKKAALNAFTRSFEDAHLSIKWQTSTNEDPFHARLIGKIFDIDTIAPGVYWVRLPVFYHSMQTDKYEQLKKATAQIPSLRAARAIIFDIRGNFGGNSILGQNILEALFGDDYKREKFATATAKIGVDWRVSTDNCRYFK